jgi:hypothetical protein
MSCYLKDTSSQMVHQHSKQVLPSIFIFSTTLQPLNPSQLFLHLIEGKHRRDTDLLVHRLISPLCKGKLLDLDLGFLYGYHPLFVFSYSSVTCVALVGFGREVFSTSCVLFIALVWVLHWYLVGESVWANYSHVLVPLGFSPPRRLDLGRSWESQLSCGDFTKVEAFYGN